MSRSASHAASKAASHAASARSAADTGLDAADIADDGDEDELDASPSTASMANATATATASDTCPQQVVIGAAHDGERIDKALAACLPAYSRGQIQDWIAHERVRLNGVVATRRQTVYGGDRVDVAPMPAADASAFLAQDLPLKVVAEDADFVVIDKPAGIVVHPAAGNWSGTVLNAMLFHYPQTAGLPRAGIVHRLDKDTSGLMVVALSLTAQVDLVRQLQARTVGRAYLAVVWGRLDPAGVGGVIDAPIGRDPRQRTRMAIVAGQAGKPARTHYRALAHADVAGHAVTLVRCRLETGRTHQIRVHLASLGHPLLGDAVYGGVSRNHPPLPGGEGGAGMLARQALHAQALGLVHPRTGETCRWEAPPPADMLTLFDLLGFGDVWR